MLSSETVIWLRRGAIAAAVSALGWAFLDDDERRVDPFAGADGALRQAASEYARLRTQEDWPGLYELVDPMERARVPWATFLPAFSHGALRVDALSVTSQSIDPAARRAKVEFLLDAHLVPERLPATFRQGLRISDTSKLRRQEPLLIDWVWRDGQWYFRLDRELVTGRTATGQSVAPLTMQQDE